MEKFKKKRTLTVLVEKNDDEGVYIARISQLPGFEVKAETMEGLLESVRKNIMMYLQIAYPDEKLLAGSEFLATDREAKA
jgi:predicted RNase H-like HicB family nuclease